MDRRTTRAKLLGILAILASAVVCPGQNPPTASDPSLPVLVPFLLEGFRARCSVGPPWPTLEREQRSLRETPVLETALDPKVDRILTRLESREVRDLHARVSWTLRHAIDLEEDAITKKGELWYQQQKPVAKFKVHFKEKISANRKHKLDEQHLFDGRWYVELNSETKTCTRRQIRRAGEVGNPYQLGEGPFPLPFGQKKADVLKEFEVSLVPGETSPPDTDHLKLVPRPETQTGRNYKQVDVWIERDGPQAGLPVKVHTSKKDGTGRVNSFLTIEFMQIELNQGFSGSVFELDCPPGYEEVVEALDPIEPPEATPSDTKSP